MALNQRSCHQVQLGVLSRRFGQILGAIHGVTLCESEQVGADVYATLFPDSDRVRILAKVIHAHDYDHPSVTVRVWKAVMQRLKNQAHDAGINNEFPEFAAGILKKAVMAGYGEEDVAALVKVWRGP